MCPATDSATPPERTCSDQTRRVEALAAEIDCVMNLAAGHSMPAGPDPSADAIRVAAYVDQAMHGGALNRPAYAVVLSGLKNTAAPQGFSVPAVNALYRLSQRYELAGGNTTTRRLAACPAVVYKALALMRRDNVTFNEIEKVAECDPILATSLLGFANSAHFARSVRLQSVAAAIAYIGLDAAKHVILAASARPLFTSLALPQLWAHSVDVAAIAEQLAGAAGMPDPSEAFVAGLIHDIGRIAIELTEQRDFVNAHSRLADASGCPCLADLVYTGCDHGDIGASFLQSWKLPSEIVDAIRYHHRPESNKSMVSSILYLAEVISNSAEDVPSPARFQFAMDTAGVKNLDWIGSDLRRLGTALAMCG